VDSEKLINLLDRAAADLGRTLPILLQINAGHDPAKFGAEPEAAPRLVEAALTRPHLQLEGLMTIAPLSTDPAVAERTFASLRGIRDDLAARFGVPLRELSMGMSGDFPAAIAAGSTLVRIGTALFGGR
jgi:pyridoxal phosphate enzyme (YggS family)